MKWLNREDFKELVTLIVIVTILGYFIAISFIPIPEESQRFVDIVLGSLLSILGKILSDYFGDNGRDKAKPESTDSTTP